MSSQLDAEQLEVIEKVQKLLRLAAKNSNENEAAAATAKAMELLAAYNLDVTTVTQTQDTGAREEQKLAGGAYEWQRDLWCAVAELNFCLYFTIKVWSRRANGTGRYRNRSRHQVVGRKVNVAATKAMAEYLEQTAERLTRERFPGNKRDWYSDEIMAYKEGIVDTIVYKLRERRKGVLDAEEAKAREEAERAARAGVSTSQAVTLASMTQSERDANADFIMGKPGWSAEQRAKRAARAAAARAAEEEYARWAAANPEEARAQEEQRRREQEEAAKKYRGGPRARETAADRRRGSGLYWQGRDAGEAVSLDQQVDTASRRRLT